MGDSFSIYLSSKGTAGLPKLKSGLTIVAWLSFLKSDVAVSLTPIFEERLSC